MRAPSLILPGLMLSLVVACQSSNESRGANPGGETLHHSDANMSIKTTDGTMRLGIASDTVYMGLTDSVLAAARADMARDTEETHSRFAAILERFVKKSVSTALRMKLKYPLADLDSASYTNGMIRFFYRNKRKIPFEDVSQNGHKALQSFAPDDAQRFVDTVNAAIRTVRGITR